VLTVYKHIKHDFKYESYLSSVKNKLFRQRIETGRYGQNRIERTERRCEICNSSDIEDEFHFVIMCLRYKWIRKRYLDSYYYGPSMFKFLELMSFTNIDVVNKLACYLNCALKIRSNELL
jgi:stalled ribosome alternative rescue factor ArfA